MKRESEILRGVLITTCATVLIVSAVVCTCVRIGSCEIAGDLGAFAASTTLTGGRYLSPSETDPKKRQPENVRKETEESEPTEESSVPAAEKPAAPAVNRFVSREPDAAALAAYEKEHEGEQRYPVNEFTITEGDIAYKGIQVKNSSSVGIDIKKELEGRLGFTIENTKEPQVLIYHTHTHESFLEFDTGYYFESFYPRSEDKTKNVCAVGEEISAQLNAAGITTLHDTTMHDNTYTGSYDRSCATVEKYLEKYPSIKVVLDIHRDGLGTDESRSKPVFYADGRKAAQIMILSGYNYDGDESFRGWEYNLRFALRIQQEAMKRYPDMLRPLYFGDFMYNMNINTGSLLIEIGADSNTVEEVRYTGFLLGDIIAKVLKDARTLS